MRSQIRCAVGRTALALVTLAAAMTVLGVARAAAATPATISDVTVSVLTPTAASVSASVAAGSLPQTVTVAYGPTVALADSAPAGSVAALATATVTATLTGLSPDTTYHFKVQSQASGAGTIVESEAGSFITPSATTPGAIPDVAAAVGYLTSPANLLDGDYYGSPGSPDIGLTIGGALGLAAAGTANAAVQSMVADVAANADAWTGFGTGDQADGAVGQEALLAEVVGDDPRSFGGHDLIAALDETTCTAVALPGCAAAGAYENGSSTFDQSLAIIAQLRAGDGTGAAAPIAYLEALQERSGAWPSLIPPTGDADVDSTAMAVMALSLVPGGPAGAAVQRADAWIVTQQQSDGGFLGASGDSTNSTALAVMALELAGSTYATQVAGGLAFLAGQQNSDGGFNVADGDHGSNLQASTQGLSGAVGTSFGTLSDPLTATTPTTPTSTTPATTTPATTTPTTTTSTITTATSTTPAPAATPAIGVTPTTSSTRARAVRPTLHHVSESHTRWRAGRKPASIARAPQPPIGTVLSFVLNERATVTLAFTQTTPGRKVGGQCVVPTDANRHHRACTRAVTIAELSLRARAGKDRIHFDGRVSRSYVLPTGRYTVLVTATADARTSSVHSLTFTIAAP